MGFLDGLFGGNRIKAPRAEIFRALVTAAESAGDRSDLRPGDKAGLLFNPEEGASMSALASDLQETLKVSELTSGTRVDLETDEFDTGWIVLRNGAFDSLVASVQALNEALFGRGNGDRLLAAVVLVDFERGPAYWIYNYKRGRFYPLVPGPVPGKGAGGNQGGRDNDAELRLGEMMENGGIAIESSIDRWYALSGIPF